MAPSPCIALSGKCLEESNLNSRAVGCAVAAVCLLVNGCGDGVDLPVATLIEKVEGGDYQSATAGNRLATPFQILATASDGSVVPREEVIWAVRQGQGAVLSDTVTVSDGNGIAQAYLTLGPSAGEYAVEAALVRRRDVVVTFTALALAAPSLTGVNPATFTAGDEVAISGANLTDSTTIFIGGREATTSNVSITGRGLWATVPACLVPGQVELIARVGLAESDAIHGTFVADTEPLALAPGEYLSLDPEALQGCATFVSATTEREYLFAPQSVTSTRGLTLSFQFRGNQVTPPIPSPERTPSERPLALRFDDFLRAQEAQLAQIPREPLVAEPLLAPIEPDIKVGDRRSFRVCSDITCSASEDFASVTGVVKYAGSRVIIYEDVEVPEDGLNDTDFNELGGLFDSDLYDVATRAFGAESDMDRNGRVLVLMTPVVNGLTEVSQCDVSFITGFFFPLDLDPKYAGDSRSNQAEVFYAMVPDPDGTVTCTHTVDRVMRVVPVTFIHEFQHMINFYQHVIVRAGSSEQTWLNEALSHMSEELGALHFEALGNSERFTAFALGDLYNAYEYLLDTEDQFPLYSEGTGDLGERGATWLLLRWLADQKGDGILRRLTESPLVGTENLEAAAGEPLAELLSDWFLANYVSNHPDLSSVPPRLQFSTWDFRATFGSLNSQDQSRFPKAFPIDPPVLGSGSFSVSGMLGSGSGAYYRVVQSAGEAGFTVELVDETGDPLSGPARPILNVIRIK
jgi:hypothetical protein